MATEDKKVEAQEEFMQVFVIRNDMNPSDTHYNGSINSKMYSFERGKSHKMTKGQGMEIVATGQGLEVK